MNVTKQKKTGGLPQTCRAYQARRKKPPGKNLRIPVLRWEVWSLYLQLVSCHFSQLLTERLIHSMKNSEYFYI